MTEVPGGAPGPDPSAGLKSWAQNEFAGPERRAQYLEPGDVDGTAKHAFPAFDRDAYLASIAWAGSIAARTHRAPIAVVRMDQLVAIQGTINRERLGQHIADPHLHPEGAKASGHGGLIDRPIVVKVDGQFFIHDGHHRLTARHLRGFDTAKVRLVDLDAERGMP
jgi:hypothetical protein